MSMSYKSQHIVFKIGTGRECVIYCALLHVCVRRLAVSDARERVPVRLALSFTGLCRNMILF